MHGNKCLLHVPTNLPVRDRGGASGFPPAWYNYARTLGYGLRALNSCLMHNPINPVLQQSRDARSRYLQFGESEHFFAEVFQGGTDVIDVCPVDNQEAVGAELFGNPEQLHFLPILPAHIYS